MGELSWSQDNAPLSWLQDKRTVQPWLDSIHGDLQELEVQQPVLYAVAAAEGQQGSTVLERHVALRHAECGFTWQPLSHSIS